MKSRALVPLALAVALSSAARLPAQFRATLAAEGLAQGRVAFGAPFPLVVERQWPAGSSPEAFDERVLAPLRVGAPTVELATHADGSFVERRRYTARATVVGDVVGTWTARWRGADGKVTQVDVALPALHVTSVLVDPASDLEWAGDVRELAPARAWWWVVVVAAIGGGVGWWMARRAPLVAGPGASPSAPAPGPSAGARALGALRALALPGPDDGAVGPFYDELARIVRDYTAERFRVPALVRTSEELTAAIPTAATGLAQCLAACDLVKFAAARPTPAQHAAAHAAACGFVAAGEGPG